MTIAFYHDHGAPAADARMLNLAVAAAARFHPGERIIHLTTENGPPTPAPAERVTVDPTGEFGARRSRSHAQLLRRLGEPVLFLDTDCHLLAPVHDVWKAPFEVAVALAERPLHPTKLPANAGVVFSRTEWFWWDVHYANEGIAWTPGDPSWLVTEQNFNRLLADYDVLWLPGAVYNHIPESRDDVPSGAKIVHWKGERKEWVI